MSESVHVENEARFAMVPEALLYDRSVSPDAVRVYGALLRHGDDPANCYPSHRRLADLLGRSMRSIPRWIAELQSAGWVEIVQRYDNRGDQVANGYRVFMTPRRAGQRAPHADERGAPPAEQRDPPTLYSAPNDSQVNESHPQRENEGPPAAAQQGELLPAPVRNTSPAVVESRRARWDLYFDAFWTAYPRKVGKIDARKAWDQARRTGADPAEIVDGARRYAADPNREDAYTAHPATWLRRGSWDDDPLPERGGAPRAQVSGALGSLAELGGIGQRAIGGGR